MLNGTSTFIHFGLLPMWYVMVGEPIITVTLQYTKALPLMESKTIKIFYHEIFVKGASTISTFFQIYFVSVRLRVPINPSLLIN